MKLLRRTQFGNPILRGKARALSVQEITSKDIQELLRNMRYTLEHKAYGVGLAAPQIGESVSIAIIGSKPTPTRPKSPKLNMTIINPKIVKRYDATEPMWEGCISGPDMYAQVPRYKRIRLQWIDEKGLTHRKDFDGLLAQIIQHEVDHLNGVLFVERVTDPKTYVMFSEYRKIRKAELKNK